jgi:hypothetical protein
LFNAPVVRFNQVVQHWGSFLLCEGVHGFSDSTTHVAFVALNPNSTIAHSCWQYSYITQGGHGNGHLQEQFLWG